jgi:hypothetical protein
MWRVTGVKGENVIDATGATRSETWHRAAEQARPLRMLEQDLGYLRLNIKERRSVKTNSRR